MGRDNLYFKNKYRIPSARLQGWDYGDVGEYFITICVNDPKIYYFGEVIYGEMNLSEIGKIVVNEWIKTATIRKNVVLDEFIVMPNHMHGIIVIEYKLNQPGLADTHLMSEPETHTMPTETHAMRLYDGGTENRRDALHASPEQRAGGNEYKNVFGPQSNNLSSIIRGFKGAAKGRIKKRFPKINFIWQPRFHDRVIRDEIELNNVRNYIINNPINWYLDKNNPNNIL
jgi:REP element-mobilizing transposase RayT